MWMVHLLICTYFHFPPLLAYLLCVMFLTLTLILIFFSAGVLERSTCTNNKKQKYSENKIKKHNRHQHIADDGGQAMGEDSSLFTEELMHVCTDEQVKQAHGGEGSEQQQGL